MSDLRKAAQAVIQAWDEPAGTTGVCRALDDLRAALAEPEQKPLTDEAVQQLYAACCPALYHFKGFGGGNFKWLVRVIEQAHGIGSKDE